jgi:hypothetical protein
MRAPTKLATKFGLILLGAVVIVGITLLGFAWLTASLYLFLEPSVGRFQACATTGAVALAPLAALGLWALGSGMRGRKEQDALLEVFASLVPQLSRTIDEMVRKNPLGSIALFAGLGMVAARNPAILTELVRALLRADDDKSGQA